LVGAVAAAGEARSVGGVGAGGAGGKLGSVGKGVLPTPDTIVAVARSDFAPVKAEGAQGQVANVRLAVLTHWNFLRHLTQPLGCTVLMPWLFIHGLLVPKQIRLYLHLFKKCRALVSGVLLVLLTS
jgi:hypothetical protein